MLFLKMLVKRMLLVMAFYQLCRLLFLLFNFSLFPHLTLPAYLHIMWGSLRFDISIIVYSNALYILLFLLPFNFRFNRLYQSMAKWIFVVVNGFCLFTNLADTAYYPFILHRTNAAFFLEFKNDTNLLGASGKFILSYWYLALIFVFILWLLIKTYQLIKMPKREDYSGRRTVADIVLIPLVVLLWLGLARGSFVPSNRPINLSYAGDYVNSPEQVNLVLNTPFSIFTTFGNIKVPEVHYYSSIDEAASFFQPVQHYEHATPVVKKNVVIIVVESLSREFVGALNRDKPGYESYTPFLDSLIPHCLVYKYAFANGKRSIEALPSVVASIPSLTEAYVLTPYAGNSINSLPIILRKHGYNTSFFHGAHEGSMGFSAFMKIAGVDRCYSKNDYNNDADFDGTWGIYDEEFLQYWAREMNTFQQPFYSSVFTVSSHHPFKYPERYKGKFKEGHMPIHPAIQYTDYALRRFFETASKMPWYKNTVFVITADHAASYAYEEDYKSPGQAFAIPILFYSPDSSLVGFKDSMIQQADIFPTVIDYLGFNDTILSFGTSILRDEGNDLVVNCYAGIYQVYYHDYLLRFDGKQEIGFYNFKTDMRQGHNLQGQLPDMETLMLQRLKAYIQQYDYRIRNNKMLP